MAWVGILPIILVLPYILAITWQLIFKEFVAVVLQIASPYLESMPIFTTSIVGTSLAHIL